MGGGVSKETSTTKTDKRKTKFTMTSNLKRNTKRNVNSFLQRHFVFCCCFSTVTFSFYLSPLHPCHLFTSKERRSTSNSPPKTHGEKQTAASHAVNGHMHVLSCRRAEQIPWDLKSCGWAVPGPNTFACCGDCQIDAGIAGVCFLCSR